MLGPQQMFDDPISDSGFDLPVRVEVVGDARQTAKPVSEVGQAAI
jgi:hypothetical protein